MDEETDSNTGIQIGKGCPELPMDDLPEPEKVFGVRHIGAREMVALVLGPSMIALGVSVGSGEWLLGPLAAARYGFMGIGWIILVSAVLQTLYNIELGRYTLATGEVPIVGFRRVPPGSGFWIVFTLIVIYSAWIWGGWAAAAGQSLFTLFTGRPHRPEELEIVRLIGIGLMVLALALFTVGGKISRTLEVFSTIMVFFVLAALVGLAVAIVPGSLWREAFSSLVVITRPGKGMDASLLGALAGYTGFASGMNFMLINYYRDKGYGMGSAVGYLSGIIGGTRTEVRCSGITFRDTPENTRRWRRWFRFLVIDQWSVFFVGAIIGMIVPCVLVAHVARIPGAEPPDMATMPIYLASRLRSLYSPWLFSFVLFVGAVTLFKTQVTILEMLVRNTTDAVSSVSGRFHGIITADPRRFYYPCAVVFVILIAVIIHLALPTRLVVISANMANLAALIFPFSLMYLNRSLPRAARPGWFGYAVLAGMVLFYGFFFTNFVAMETLGRPLLRF